MSATLERPTFGSVLRAARLGYHWSEKLGAFLRVSGDGPFVFDLAPATGVPKQHAKGEHRVWWDTDEGRNAVLSCGALRGIRRVSRPFRITVGDDGERASL